jgi:RimK family alpha-L-glutamate ligase
VAVLIAATETTPTNAALLEAFVRRGVPASVEHPRFACGAGSGDVVVGRLDVRPTLGGAESGISSLAIAAEAGVTVRNGADALLACHDKLLTALLLGASGVPHPATRVVYSASDPVDLPLPVVVKPRFGSWGRDVVLCRTDEELRETLADLERRPWFGLHGALVQELVPPRGHDLRVIVAAGRVVGAILRQPAPGEWRTNVALGARRVPVAPPRSAGDLARRAAAVVRGDLVGVDLLPTEAGWTVLELNGAVEFTSAYSAGSDVFDEVARAIVGCAAAPVSAARAQARA